MPQCDYNDVISRNSWQLAWTTKIEWGISKGRDKTGQTILTHLMKKQGWIHGTPDADGWVGAITSCNSQMLRTNGKADGRMDGLLSMSPSVYLSICLSPPYERHAIYLSAIPSNLFTNCSQIWIYQWVRGSASKNIDTSYQSGVNYAFLDSWISDMINWHKFLFQFAKQHIWRTWRKTSTGQQHPLPKSAMWQRRVNARFYLSSRLPP